MLDLEDAVAENQKDHGKILPVSCQREIDYRGVERVVRINGLDTPALEGKISVSAWLAVLIPSVSQRPSAQDIHTVMSMCWLRESLGRPGSTLLMGAGVLQGCLKCPEVCKSSDRLIQYYSFPAVTTPRICRP